MRDGTLTLAGKLEVNGDATPNAGTTLNFFDSSGLNPVIAGAFGMITDLTGGTPTGSIFSNNPQLKYFRLTW